MSETTDLVDFDTMALARFHRIEVPLWGESGTTAAAIGASMGRTSEEDQRPEVARRWKIWREENVVIKILPRSFAADERRRARFEREAKAVAALDHPNICTLHDVGSEDELYYLVMELLDGETIAVWLKKERFSLRDLLRIGAGVANGLDRAHHKGIGHRDLTPGIIMPTSSGAKLLDFGLAQICNVFTDELRQASTESQPLTAEGSLMGTLSWVRQFLPPHRRAGTGHTAVGRGCEGRTQRMGATAPPDGHLNPPTYFPLTVIIHRNVTIEAGARLGPYEIVAPIGAGGMGEVYRARDTRLDREVAVKVLPPGFASDHTRRARFDREAKTIAALNHPNICTIHDVGHEDGVHYLVMELLEGESLANRLKNERVPLDQLLRYGAQIADGLHRAHGKGIIHRDLTPGNVMLTKTGAKLLDFGLAQITTPSAEELRRLSTEARPLTAEGTLLGTMPYMAPEQLHGKEADARTDIFALGSVLYEMATGCRAFFGESRASLIAAIVSGEPRPIHELQPLTPLPLEHVIRKCLEKDPDDRWQSARDVATELRWIETRVNAPDAAALSIHSRLRRWKSISLLLGVLAVAGMSIAAAMLIPRSREPNSAVSQAPAIRFKQLSFRRGNTMNARFSPDGTTVFFSASWDGAPVQIYAVGRDGVNPRPIGISNANLLAVSDSGELAVLLLDNDSRSGHVLGTLARVAQIGGTPRVLADHVSGADWLPGGEQMAAVRFLGKEWVVEAPLGNVLYKSPERIFDCNVSPDGLHIVIANRHDALIVDRNGTVRHSFDANGITSGFAWSPDSREVVVSDIGLETGQGGTIYAVGLNGASRQLLATPGMLSCSDVAADGALLVDPGGSDGSIVLVRDDGSEHEFSWLGRSVLWSIAASGDAILMSDRKPGLKGMGPYFRRLDGTPPTFLHATHAFALTPDASGVLVRNDGDPELLQLVPTGIGAPRPLGRWPVVQDVEFLPDGSAAILVGSPEGGQFGLYRLDVNDGSFERIAAPEIPAPSLGPTLLRPSPDSKLLGFRSPDRTPAVLDLGNPLDLRQVPGTTQSEEIAGWSADSRSVFIVTEGLPRNLHRVDLATGRRSLARTLQPRDSGGLVDISHVWVANDGETILYGVFRVYNSNIWIAEGVL